MTVGSVSTKTARGTCRPDDRVRKNELYAGSSGSARTDRRVDGWDASIVPSGWIPCSRQKSSQHLSPIWHPACPT